MGGPEGHSEAVDGYTVDAQTKSVTMTTGTNEIVFNYTKRADLSYTVKYVALCLCIHRVAVHRLRGLLVGFPERPVLHRLLVGQIGSVLVNILHRVATR